MRASLNIENISKNYTGFKLNHVSFNIPKGTIMGLIGENRTRYILKTISTT